MATVVNAILAAERTLHECDQRGNATPINTHSQTAYCKYRCSDVCLSSFHVLKNLSANIAPWLGKKSFSANLNNVKFADTAAKKPSTKNEDGFKCIPPTV
jgi:hypothetical protein